MWARLRDTWAIRLQQQNELIIPHHGFIMMLQTFDQVFVYVALVSDYQIALPAEGAQVLAEVMTLNNGGRKKNICG